MTAATQAFDVIVLGAGPAGAMAAHQAARGGASVLLVEKASLPRGKVCGCCLSAAALAELDAAGLGDIPAACAAPATTRLDLRCRGRRVVLPLPRGAALSRAVFDAALTRRACEAGAELRTQTSAAVIEPGVVRLRNADGTREVKGRMVIDATGLASAMATGWHTGGAGRAARSGWSAPDGIVARSSRMGAGVVIEGDGAPAIYGPGVIHMACGRGGYVGLVRLEDGRLDVAAAMDPRAIKQAGGPGALAAAILEEAGMPAIPQLAESPWRGTPLLTRRPASVAGPRLLRVGDAAGYVEPFTGEGIAWALATGRAAAALAVEAARLPAWLPRFETQWAATHRCLVRHRMRRCALIARLLRHPHVMSWTVALLNCWPRGAARVADLIQTPIGAA